MFCYKLTFNSLSEGTEDNFRKYLRKLNERFIMLNEAEIIKSDKGFFAVIFTFKKNLSEIINSEHIKNTLGIDREQAHSLEYMGLHIDYRGVCKCENSPFYILDTNIGDDGPLICGRCHENIDVSRFKGPIHIDLFNWEKAYRDMYDFWLCSIDDKTAFYELNDVNSELSKYGSEICQSFSSQYGIAVFYTLYKDINEKLCPKCSKELNALDERQKPYTHICENCGFIFIEQDYKELM